MVYPPLIKSASKAMLLARLNWDAHNPAHQAVYLQMKVTESLKKKKKKKAVVAQNEMKADEVSPNPPGGSCPRFRRALEGQA